MTDQIKPRCPKCGSSDIGRVAYGWRDEALERAELDGELTVGGQRVDENQPTHFCRECSHRWNQWPNGGIAIPPVGAAWSWIVMFADTYNGYEHHGDLEGLTALHDQQRRKHRLGEDLSNDVGVLRAMLFYEYRSDRFGGGYGPDEKERNFIDAVLARLFEVTDGTVPGPSESPEVTR